MKKISLTQNKVVLLDDQDYLWARNFKWWFDGRYACREVHNKKVYLHRLLLVAPGNKQIDHINGNPLDNRRNNLRFCTPSQNIANSIKKRITASPHKGVSFVKRIKKWEAFIGKDNKKIHLGLFSTEKAAAQAYTKKAKEIFGEFANVTSRRGGM